MLPGESTKNHKFITGESQVAYPKFGKTLDDDLKSISQNINMNDDEEYKQLLQEEQELDNEIKELEGEIKSQLKMEAQERDLIDHYQRECQAIQHQFNEIQIHQERLVKSSEYQKYGYVTRQDLIDVYKRKRRPAKLPNK